MKKLFILTFACLLCMALALLFSTMFIGYLVHAENEGLPPVAEEKCAVTSLKDSLRSSAAIFVGTVVEAREEGDRKIFKFRVEKYWKGVTLKTKTVEVYVFQTTRYPASYQLDKKYLVYAEKDDEGKLRDRRCSRSGEVAWPNAVADMRQLGRAKIVR